MSQASMLRDLHMDDFSNSAKNFASLNSLSRKSLAQQTVIKGGKKRSKQLEDRRYKLARRANFDYLDKMQEEKAKHSNDLKS
eukprot:CAMPEP_0185599862 /NCGR_PEP_ID=MMETSP0434-20130131/82995_1 /TAXON_ID=626734 ORGANISM="Favella taraikaensis, Strain Fe Narragansett Bay" /NCGR_SAMPLE_ID=MMETSP0434 /ASSEMBLY_ACC=CAM_ASM_000379 /LENGTH=81 /DNA_ID=CAMNT_0028229419 /DNA_START=1045 /DNA_END=1290 /DNA_ORIENTATION=-